MSYADTNVVGIPSTILAWMSILQIVQMDPIMSIAFKLLSSVWLCMQIYGWIEKRIKDKKNVSQQESRKSSSL
jgi:hypothetical protein